MKFLRNVIECIGIDNPLVEFGMEASDTLLDGSIFAFEFTSVEIEKIKWDVRLPNEILENMREKCDMSDIVIRVINIQTLW